MQYTCGLHVLHAEKCGNNIDIVSHYHLFRMDSQLHFCYQITFPILSRFWTRTTHPFTRFGTPI